MKSDGGADPTDVRSLWTRHVHHVGQVFAVFHQHYQKKMIMMHSDAVDICDEGRRGGGSRSGDQRGSGGARLLYRTLCQRVLTRERGTPPGPPIVPSITTRTT